MRLKFKSKPYLVIVIILFKLCFIPVLSQILSVEYVAIPSSMLGYISVKKGVYVLSNKYL